MILTKPDILFLSPTFPATESTAENVISGTRHLCITSAATNTVADSTGSNAAALADLQQVKSIRIITGVSFVINDVILNTTSVAYPNAFEKQTRASPLMVVKKVKNAA